MNLFSQSRNLGLNIKLQINRKYFVCIRKPVMVFNIAESLILNNLDELKQKF